MQVIEIVQEVLKTGKLTVSLERQMESRLALGGLNETEIAAIDNLIEAISQGRVRSVPDYQRCESVANDRR